MSGEEKLFIFAGTYKRARDYAMKNRLGCDWIYIKGAESLRGHRNGKVKRLSCFYLNNYRNEIEEMIMEREMNIIE